MENSSEVDRLRLSYYKRWDFQNQQGTSFVAPGIPFKQNDRILTRCHYNSTVGGSTSGGSGRCRADPPRPR